jgi:hypothetical protein
MNIEALRVFNVIHKLNLTEQEFKEIEEEQSHAERTGLSIVTTKTLPSNRVLLVCVSHDEREKIVIKENGNKIIPEPHSRILFKTLVTFDGLPQEVYTLHGIAQYRSLDLDIKSKATNIEELKDRIIDRFADKYPKELGGEYDCYSSSEDEKSRKANRIKAVEHQLKAVFWLFGEDYNKFNPQTARMNVARIIKVFQRGNKRLAIIHKNDKYEQTSGFGMFHRTQLIENSTFQVISFSPKDERYNWVSPNREFYTHYGDFQVWLDDSMFEKVAKKELEIICSRRDKNGWWLLLTAEEYGKQQEGIRAELYRAKREEQEEQNKEQLTRKITQQFKKGKVVRGGITFTHNKVSYEGITLSGDKVSEFLNQNNVPLQEHPDFNTIFESYVDYVLFLKPITESRYSNEVVGFKSELKEKVEFKIGSIKVLIDKRINNLYVNGNRVTLEDVAHVVKKAITYNSQKEYDLFLEECSKTSLKLQKALKEGGFTFKLITDNTEDIPFKNEGMMLLVLPLTREGNKSYTEINGKKYQVSDINSLFSLGKSITGYLKSGHLQRTISLLYKGIKGITPKEIGELIQEGKEKFVQFASEEEKREMQRVVKSEEFVAHAVKLTKAVKVDGGYSVTGISGTEYYVRENDNSVWRILNGVYDQDNSEHLCIVDNDYSWEGRENKAQQNDRLAKRLLMLSKDKKVAQEVFERGDGMNRWWNEISDKKEEMVENE